MVQSKEKRKIRLVQQYVEAFGELLVKGAEANNKVP